MNIKFDLYKDGKTKALTFSYDDGATEDIKLTQLFDKYNVKGTFHLNSSKIGAKNFITKVDVKTIYKNHEIAAHTVTHPYLTSIPHDMVINEILDDRKILEEYTEQPVEGFSYPYGDYNHDVISALKSSGIKYARTAGATNNYRTPSDWFKWTPTCHHNHSIIEKADIFLENSIHRPMSLFYIWGHSYEFREPKDWEVMEMFLKKVAFNDDIWYATNLELYYYITAIKSLSFSMNRKRIVNNSNISVWIRVDDKKVKIFPGVNHL